MAGLLLLHSFVAVAWLRGAAGLRDVFPGDLPSGLLAQDQQMAFEETGGLPPAHRMLVENNKRAAKNKRDAAARAKKQKEEKARKEKEAARRKAAHKKEHLKDCKWSETWGAPGECSATCGGGVRSEPLQQRWVTQKQDEYGYGDECPPECKEGTCTEERYSPCKMEPCASDCSVVDLGNRVPASGTATAWKGGGLGCVYQFWQVEGKALKLLAETDPQEGEGADPTIWALSGDVDYEGKPERVVDDSNKPLPYMLSTRDKHSIVLGFRSCTKPVPQADSSRKPPSIAKVCIWGSVGFQDHSQNRGLSIGGQRSLQEYRRMMRSGYASENQKVGWSGSLVKQAWKGVSSKTAGVTFEGDTQEPTKAAYTLQVTMAAQPPYPPELAEEHTQVDGGVRLVLAKGGSNNGAEVEGYRVFARKIFNTRPGNDRGNGYCQFELVPNCQEGLQVPCVDKELTLRHFAPGSALEVHVGGVNSAGSSKYFSKKAIARTSVEAGESWDKCPVDRWTSMEESVKKADQESFDEGPEEGEPHCRFDAPPVPQCRMKKQTDWKGSPLCHDKRYWRPFRPVDAAGKDLTDCAGTLEGVCRQVNELEEQKSTKCKSPGCSRTLGFIKSENCCCRAGAEGQEDSPDCACESEECESLGLVEATDEDKSCRH